MPFYINDVDNLAGNMSVKELGDAIHASVDDLTKNTNLEAIDFSDREVLDEYMKFFKVNVNLPKDNSFDMQQAFEALDSINDEEKTTNK